MLSKIRHNVDIKTLKPMYCAIFDSHLSYASLVWVHNSSSVKRLHILQKNSVFLKLKCSHRCSFQNLKNFKNLVTKLHSRT